MSDLISRQAEINTAIDMCDCCDTCDIVDYRDLMIEALSVLPSAQPELKRGRWIKVGDNSYKCSVCNEISCCMGNYCPDCGSGMRGEKDGRDS